MSPYRGKCQYRRKWSISPDFLGQKLSVILSLPLYQIHFKLLFFFWDMNLHSWCGWKAWFQCCFIWRGWWSDSIGVGLLAQTNMLKQKSVQSTNHRYVFCIIKIGLVDCTEWRSIQFKTCAQIIKSWTMVDNHWRKSGWFKS